MKEWAYDVKSILEEADTVDCCINTLHCLQQRMYVSLQNIEYDTWSQCILTFSATLEVLETWCYRDSDAGIVLKESCCRERGIAIQVVLQI